MENKFKETEKKAVIKILYVLSTVDSELTSAQLAFISNIAENNFNMTAEDAGKATQMDFENSIMILLNLSRNLKELLRAMMYEIVRKGNNNSSSIKVLGEIEKTIFAV